MPHDRFGRKLSLGDVIIAKPYNQRKPGTNESVSVDDSREYVGTIMEITEAQSCTGQMRYLDKSDEYGIEVLLKKDYFGAEDATLILKANGSHPEVVVGVDMAAEGCDKTVETVIENDTQNHNWR